METEFVRTKVTGDCRMDGEVHVEFVDRPNVVDTLFKLANEARRKADPRYAQPAQFTRDEYMLGMRRGVVRFVHRYLNFEGIFGQ